MVGQTVRYINKMKELKQMINPKGPKASSKRENEQERLVFIDVLECLGIVFVVFYHSTLYIYNILESNSAIYDIRYFMRSILSTCVPIFFFTNGYLLLNRKFDLDKHIKKDNKNYCNIICMGGLVLV